MQKIKKVSRFFQLVFQAGFVVFLFAPFIFWIFAPDISNSSPFSINMIPDSISITHTLSPLDKFYGFLISWIPNTIDLLAIYFLIKLFGLYQQGKIFVSDSVNYLKKIGYTLLLGEILNPFYDLLMSFALTWHNPIGERSISLGFGTPNIAELIIAGLVILIAWIMAEGVKLREEQALTV